MAAGHKKKSRGKGKDKEKKALQREEKRAKQAKKAEKKAKKTSGGAEEEDGEDIDALLAEIVAEDSKRTAAGVVPLPVERPRHLSCALWAGSAACCSVTCLRDRTCRPPGILFLPSLRGWHYELALAGSSLQRELFLAAARTLLTLLPHWAPSA